ncbi:diguanylate cyclase [uncultured Paraglaciecola sp.]|uniref:GGDEF domain-containing response regulator n=1 Tax=uncultured Paraglaciecola sp. TaxID=1765024 RepID=UPI002592ED24|nr:diguanylate cyclase [uncultured Paraglaciecola sp.]
MFATSNNILQAAESDYLGRVFTEPDQTLMLIGSGRSLECLSTSFAQIFNVITTSHTSDIFQACGDQDVDMIILYAGHSKDLWVETLRQIRSNSMLNFIPVIVLTETNSINAQLIALELGALDCMVKPVNTFLLNAKITNYMKLMKNFKELELISCTDGLTGLANKMQLNTRLKSEWYRMKRNNLPLSALMVDVDHFKHFNDTFGHIEGDECLKKVADVIKHVAARDSDFGARFGGEEFAILLPNTDHEGAIKVAKAILQKLRILQVPHKHEGSKYLSVSIGISSCEPHSIEDVNLDPMWLLEEADSNLYKAKHNGRNRYWG